MCLDFSQTTPRRSEPDVPKMVARIKPIFPFGFVTPVGRTGSVAWREFTASVTVRAERDDIGVMIIAKRREMMSFLDVLIEENIRDMIYRAIVVYFLEEIKFSYACTYSTYFTI